MTATDRAPTTRILTLAAIILAAGVLSFRAFDLFANSKAEPVGSSLEREITYLLEPLTGAGDVRVSVSGRTDRQILIMMNGDVGEDLRALRTQVESVLGASLGYDPQTDTLTLTQFPFARGVGSSFTLFQIAEFTGLSLLTILLLLIYTAPTRTAAPVKTAPPVEPETTFRRLDRVELSEREPPSDLRSAARLAESRSEDTARMVRGWMSYTEES